MVRRSFPLTALIGVLAACGGSSTSPTDSTALQVVNGATTAGTVVVYIDGVAQTGSVAAGMASLSYGVTAGAHDVELRPTAGGSGKVKTFQFDQGKQVTAVGLDSGGTVTSQALADTGSIVPAGHSKLRVSHMAPLAPRVDIWRTQPDFATPIRVEFPFPYGATSPYLQSTPGNWIVYVTDTVPSSNPNAPMPLPTMAQTPSVTVPDGESRTVILLDQTGGGLTLVVVKP